MAAKKGSGSLNLQSRSHWTSVLPNIVIALSSTSNWVTGRATKRGTINRTIQLNEEILGIAK